MQAESHQYDGAQPGRLHRLPLLLGLFVFLVLFVVAGMWLAEPENLPLRTVRIQGDLHQVSAQQVHDAVMPYAQAGFLRIDIASIRAVLEQMPWVHSVQVRRAWPDVLLVQLHEQQVLARWADGGLVNPEGRVFRPLEPITASGLPLLQGPPGTSVMVTAQFVELQRTLSPLQMSISAVTMDERRAWRLVLDNGLELMLGRSEHIARMERFARAWPQVLGPRSATVQRVDLRYTNGFAVQWRQS